MSSAVAPSCLYFIAYSFNVAPWRHEVPHHSLISSEYLSIEMKNDNEVVKSGYHLDITVFYV